MDYKTKYLKYKYKYTELKKKINNIGGVDDYLSDYFIASSHNTYLEGDQLFSKSNLDCYKNFLEFFKGGCIELDLINYDPEKNDVEIKHEYTLTSIIYLTDVLTIIKTFIEKNLDSFIILSIDNKLKDKNTEKAYNIFKKILGEYLYDLIKPDYTISEIKGKILLKWNKNIHDKSKTHFDKTNVISDSKFYNITQTDIINNNKLYNKKYKRIYPKWYNIASNNYPFTPQLINGTQMVALNCQKPDLHMMIMREFFKKTFYVKKPQWMLKINTIKEVYCDIPVKKISLKFSDRYKNITVFKQNETDFIQSEKNEFNIKLIMGFEYVYIICDIDNQTYHGVINIIPNQKSRLYKKTKIFNEMSCDWYIKIDDNDNFIDIELEINNSDVFIK